LGFRILGFKDEGVEEADLMQGLGFGV
jgi:hypothetical protein